MEVLDAPVLEDVGAEASEKSVEEVARVSVEETNDRFFLIGSAMPNLEHDTYSNSLRSHADVFSWTPYEEPGLKPRFAFHQLNVDPAVRPVVQRPRRSVAIHTEAVVEKVGKLLEAEAIWEIQYPTWLANTIMVKKENGKFRVCVDYTNLNDACPKDPFPHIR